MGPERGQERTPGGREWGRGQPAPSPACSSSRARALQGAESLFQGQGWIYPKLLVPFPPQSQGSSRGLWRSPAPPGPPRSAVTGSPFNLLVLQPCSHMSVQSQRNHTEGMFMSLHTAEVENVSLKGLNFAHKHPGGAGGYSMAWMSQLASHCPQKVTLALPKAMSCLPGGTAIFQRRNRSSVLELIPQRARIPAALQPLCFQSHPDKRGSRYIKKAKQTVSLNV